MADATHHTFQHKYICGIKKGHQKVDEFKANLYFNHQLMKWLPGDQLNMISMHDLTLTFFDRCPEVWKVSFCQASKDKNIMSMVDIAAYMHS